MITNKLTAFLFGNVVILSDICQRIQNTNMMETKNTNRMESRSKDFAAFMQTANIGKDSRDYLVLVGELENWSRRCHEVIGRDWQDGTNDNTIAECIDTIEQRLLHYFADSVFDNAMDSDSTEL